MKKGFPADETTIGGRARKSRLNAGYTIKDFAAMLEVSPNHLGLIERGEKQASFKLLQKIAKMTDTSYQWIIKGDQQKEASIPSPVDRTEKVDLRLFLGLILAVAPAISKAALVSLLSTTPDMIDRILSGEAVEWDPQWPSLLPTLAGLLGNITTVRNNLRELDQFLADVELERNMNILKESLIRYLSDKYGQHYKLRQPISHGLQQYISEKDYVEHQFQAKWTTILLYNADNPQEIWQFQLLQSLDTLDEEDMTEIFYSVADMAESMRGNLTILFQSEDDYDVFSRIASRAMDKVDMADAGYAAMGLPSSADADTAFGNLSYALIDNGTWRVMTWNNVNP